MAKPMQTNRRTIELSWWELNSIDTIRALVMDGAPVSSVKAVHALLFSLAWALGIGTCVGLDAVVAAPAAIARPSSPLNSPSVAVGVGLMWSWSGRAGHPC